LYNNALAKVNFLTEIKKEKKQTKKGEKAVVAYD